MRTRFCLAGRNSHPTEEPMRFHRGRQVRRSIRCLLPQPGIQSKSALGVKFHRRARRFAAVPAKAAARPDAPAVRGLHYKIGTISPKPRLLAVLGMGQGNRARRQVGLKLPGPVYEFGGPGVSIEWLETNPRKGTRCFRKVLKLYNWEKWYVFLEKQNKWKTEYRYIYERKRIRTILFR